MNETPKRILFIHIIVYTNYLLVIYFDTVKKLFQMMPSITACAKKDYRKGALNGYRIYVTINNSVYEGEWNNDKRNGKGTLTHKNGFTYEGNWLNNQRHGYGVVRKQHENGLILIYYIGQFCHNKKCGEGKQFYRNGNIYFGQWKDNQRSGLGILWLEKSTYSMYIGQWLNDKYNGIGVLFQDNGNRYEGNFKNGLKHGEGTYYHEQTGQIQKGMWEEDICKTSMMQDEYRNEVLKPTEYPIPRIELQKPGEVIHNCFRRYMLDIREICSCCSLELLSCMDLVKQTQN